MWIGIVSLPTVIVPFIMSIDTSPLVDFHTEKSSDIEALVDVELSETDVAVPVAVRV